MIDKMPGTTYLYFVIVAGKKYDMLRIEQPTVEIKLATYIIKRMWLSLLIKVKPIVINTPTTTNVNKVNK